MPQVRRVQVLNVEKVFPNGNSVPVLARCRGGTDSGVAHYVVKWRGNPRGPTQLASELICALLGEAVRLPMPPFALVDVPGSIRRDLNAGRVPGLRLPAALQEGPHFGSLYLRHVAIPVRSPSKPYKGLVNPEDLSLAMVFDVWVLNNDREKDENHLLLQEAPGRYRFYAVDHGDALAWKYLLAGALEDLVALEKPVACHPYIAAGSHPRYLDAAVKRIASVPDQQIDTATSALPLAWGLPKEAGTLAADLLKRRRDRLASLREKLWN